MKYYTIDNVEKLLLSDLESAIRRSFLKWKWLSSEKKDVLIRLWKNNDIYIGVYDCPMCKFIDSCVSDSIRACDICPLTSVCLHEYQDAGIFEHVAFDNLSIVEFRKQAKRMKNRIAEIYKAIYGRSIC